MVKPVAPEVTLSVSLPFANFKPEAVSPLTVPPKE
jgi:hypothetical protein